MTDEELREPGQTENTEEHLWKKRLREQQGKETFSLRKLLILPSALIYSELLLRMFCGENILRLIGYPILFALSPGLILTAVCSVFSPRTNRLLTKLFLLLTAVWFSVATIIQSVFHVYMSVGNLLTGAGNVSDNYSGELWRSVFFGIPKALCYFLPLVLLFVRRKKDEAAAAFPKGRAVLTALAGLILGCVTAFAASRGSQGSLYGSHFDFNYSTKAFGLVTSSRLDLKYRIFGRPSASFGGNETVSDDSETVVEETSETEYAAPAPVSYGKNQMALDFEAVKKAHPGGDIETLTEYLESRSSSSKNAYTGIFEGKNLIMISAESYCGAFISEELTPTLWRLTHNGFYFSEYYQPEWGGSTTSGEEAILVGLVPRDGDEAMIRTEGNNNYFTMGNQLQRRGYSSCAFHNGDMRYYQRNETHANLGYNQFIADENGLYELLGVPYAHDEDMINATMDFYLDKQPFNIYYMTISGHAPYEADSEFVAEYYGRVGEAVGDRYEEETLYYICYQMELESALTRMVQRLEEAGIADDTVIMLVGDHYPYGLGRGEAWGNDDDYVRDLLGTDDDTDWNRDRNTLILWSGALEGALADLQCEVSDPVFSLDILPTLSNLFGLEFDSRLLAGRDVFAPDAEPLVFWGNRSFVTGEGYYDEGSDSFYPRSGGEERDEDWMYVDAVKKEIEDRVLMSELIVDDDYYRLLFGEDTLTFAGEQIFPTEEEES